MGRLFHKMLVGALLLVVANLTGGIAQAQGQWMLGFPANRQLVNIVNGRVISLSADEDGDISMEVIGFVPNQQRNGQGMMQSGQVYQSADARNPGAAGTAGTDFGAPGTNQFAGPDVQTSPMGANRYAGSDTLDGVGIANVQQQTVAQQPINGPPFSNGGGFGNHQTPVNVPSNPQVTSQIGGPQNTFGGTAPSVAAPGMGHLFRDSDEFHDFSVESDMILGQDGRFQPAIHLSGDSNEYDDASLEVDLNLLPRIRNLLTTQLSFQTQEHQVGNRNPGMVFFQDHDDRDSDMSLELQGIIANPAFQQQIQDIDVRLKRAPAARGKRLMEKYAEALALSSHPSSNSTAPATVINSSFYLSLLITWISVSLIL